MFASTRVIGAEAPRGGWTSAQISSSHIGNMLPEAISCVSLIRSLGGMFKLRVLYIVVTF